MEPCPNAIIPERLHTGDKREVTRFKVGELLYRRCKEDQLNHPFETISLYDLSLNRATINDAHCSLPSDVLFILEPLNNESTLYEESVINLIVKEVSEERETYFKILHDFGEQSQEGKPTKHELTMLLRHAALPCNYAHCVIEVAYDGAVLQKENYDQLFGKKKGPAKKLRNKARFEIAKMILHKELWINDAM